MSESSAELRQLVATEHGLPAETASFLRGATVEEIEESALALARLLRDRREESPPDFFSAAATAKAARQRALVNLLTGRPPQQPRDERGRFAAGGFDGGVRPGLARTPESHDEMLIRVLRSREADHGAVGFGR
jgi:hypothetical protein